MRKKSNFGTTTRREPNYFLKIVSQFTHTLLMAEAVQLFYPLIVYTVIPKKTKLLKDVI